MANESVAQVETKQTTGIKAATSIGKPKFPDDILPIHNGTTSVGVYQGKVVNSPARQVNAVKTEINDALSKNETLRKEIAELPEFKGIDSKDISLSLDGKWDKKAQAILSHVQKTRGLVFDKDNNPTLVKSDGKNDGDLLVADNLYGPRTSLVCRLLALETKPIEKKEAPAPEAQPTPKLKDFNAKHFTEITHGKITRKHYQSSETTQKSNSPKTEKTPPDSGFAPARQKVEATPAAPALTPNQTPPQKSPVTPQVTPPTAHEEETKAPQPTPTAVTPDNAPSLIDKQIEKLSSTLSKNSGWPKEAIKELMNNATADPEKGKDLQMNLRWGMASTIEIPDSERKKGMQSQQNFVSTKLDSKTDDERIAYWSSILKIKVDETRALYPGKAETEITELLKSALTADTLDKLIYDKAIAEFEPYLVASTQNGLPTK